MLLIINENDGDEMSIIQAKRVEDSKSENVQLVLAQHINGYDRLFGGQLVAWIDILAGVVARRHSNRNVTTATIDNLQFKRPAHINDVVVLIGKITYVGKTSMEVRVDTYIEDLKGEQELINTAHLVLVALDEKEQPIEVPRLILETDEEKAEWEAAAKRRQLRKQRRIEQF